VARLPRWVADLPPLRRDPVMVAAGLWTLLACVLLFVLDLHGDAQVRVFWWFQPPLDAVLAYSSWRVSRIATGTVRRFWLVLAVAGTMFTIGDSVQAVSTLTRPDAGSSAGGTVQTVCFAVGLGSVVVAMLVHPHPGRSGRERLAFWLDSATVLVGGAVVAWCFAVGPGANEASDVISTLAVGAVILTAGFAAVKMILSGNAPMHRSAAAPMIISAGVNSFGFFLAPGGTGALPAYVFAIRFVPSLLIAAGPRIQELLARFDQTTAFSDRRRKPYSLLPYGSIAVAFTALVVVLPAGLNARLWGVVTGVGIIFALVVGRQLAAFHDNTSLIKRLDTTLEELREHEARLRHQALFDGLTGLANRTHLHEEATSTLDACVPGTVSLLLIDLDGFKAVNDTLGHAAGDALLAAVAGHLHASVRDGDLVARLGGDEFAVLLRDCGADDAEQTSQRILRSLATPVAIGGTHIRAGASIGVACADAGQDVEALMRQADVAMYAAKREGKGTWMCYDLEMEAGTVSQLSHATAPASVTAAAAVDSTMVSRAKASPRP
jgi:diguanylate cyclase